MIFRLSVLIKRESKIDLYVLFDSTIDFNKGNKVLFKLLKVSAAKFSSNILDFIWLKQGGFFNYSFESNNKTNYLEFYNILTFLNLLSEIIILKYK